MGDQKEVLHWADQAARKIIDERGDKEQYVIAAGITPSGVIHIGNFREIITIDLIRRGLESLGKKVRFLYSWDDYDVFRKVPANMPDQDFLKKFLRTPITDVPDTDRCHESYARHNEAPVEEAIPIVGINPQYLYQHKKYKNCEYAKEMKTALESTEKIKEILNKFRKEPLEDSWLPVSIFCEKCKKDTITSLEYPGGYNLAYECDCGHKDTFDFRKKGIAKLKWRIDWPMRWAYEKVDFESGGKDHFAAGGAFWTGQMILKDIFKAKLFPSIRYEWISIKGGKQLHSSTGNVVTLNQLLEIYEPAIARYLFAGTRPEAEFAISFDLDVLKIYEDFDKCERIYFDKEEGISGKEKEKQKRIYELSCVKIPKKMPFQPSFRHLTNMLQIHEMDIGKAMKEYDLKTEGDKKKFRARAQCCINWLMHYADDNFKFKVKDDVPPGLELSAGQKKALAKIADVLKTDVKGDAELHEKIYGISQEAGIKPAELFKAAYKVLINKEKGPRLANFILTIGKKRVISLFEKI
ncbi:lysine--tRNA ligase [Candidatus Woesearchaeota archaeon]|nr:lysine--tRNA ligase [Candidatus Woesearchaeota archaeon]